MTNIDVKMYKWCNTSLEWFEYPGTECIVTPQDRYREAKKETLSLWNDGWICKYEARAILLSLFRARYLTTYLRR